MSLKTNVTAAFIALAAAGTANATTINPDDYTNIFTEGKRVATIDGADVSGNAAVGRNINIDNFDLSAITGSNLLAGRVGVNRRGVQGSDAWTYTGTGSVEFSVANFGLSSRGGATSFGVTFAVLIDGVVQQTMDYAGTATDNTGFSFGSYDLTNQSISFIATGTDGFSDYDVTVSASSGNNSQTTPVPLPATGLMLLAGLGGLAAMRRRKQQG